MSLGCAGWTAGAGLGLVAVLAWICATDHELGRSTAAGAQHGWHAAAALVAVLPLVVVLGVRAHDRLSQRRLDR